MIHFACPECGGSIKAPEEMLGQRAKCPKCGRVVQIHRPTVTMEPPPFDPMQVSAAVPAADYAPRGPMLENTTETWPPNNAAERPALAKRSRRNGLWVAVSVAVFGLSAASGAWYFRGATVESQTIDWRAKYEQERQKSESAQASLRKARAELQAATATLKAVQAAAEQRQSAQKEFELKSDEIAALQGEIDRANKVAEFMGTIPEADWNRGLSLLEQSKRTGMTNELALKIGGLLSFRVKALKEYLQQHPELAPAAAEIEAKFQRRENRLRELDEKVVRTGWTPEIALEYESVVGYEKDSPWSQYLDGIRHPRDPLIGRAVDALSEPDPPPLEPPAVNQLARFVSLPRQARLNHIRYSDARAQRYVSRLMPFMCSAPELPDPKLEAIIKTKVPQLDFAPLSKGVAIITCTMPVGTIDGMAARDAIPVGVQLKGDKFVLNSYCGRLCGEQFVVALVLHPHADKLMVAFSTIKHQPIAVEWTDATGKLSPVAILTIDRAALVNDQVKKAEQEQAERSKLLAEEAKLAQKGFIALMGLRTWSTTDGRRSVRGEFRSYKQSVLTVRTSDLDTVTFELNELDEASRKQLQSILRARKEGEAKKPPNP